MSGRVRVELADGRKVTGFRKTLRRQTPRPPTHVAPELRLIFQLPEQLAWSVPQGKHGIGVEVGPAANVEVTTTTFDRHRLFALAASFLQAIAPKGTLPFNVAAVYTSSSEPNWSDKWRVAYVDGHVLISKTPIDMVIFPAPAK
jgi:hypothetical protein